MEVSSSHQAASHFHWDPQRDDLNTTATTSTAVMPVLLSHPPAAVDNTLPLDPSFVDVDHPDLGRKTPVPSRGSNTKRKASVGSSATATVSGEAGSSSASGSGPSKLRSVSTPTPPTSVHPAPRSSSKSRGHRSTKSHGYPHEGDHIREDLLLNLLKEFRAAKKKEREGTVDSGAGSVSLSQGVKTLLSHGSRRPQQAAQDRDHSSPPSYDSTTRPPTQKARERSLSSASISTPPKTRPRAKSTSSTTTEIVLLLSNLKQETIRANAAEAQLNELLERYKVMRQGKLNAEAQLAVIREELRLYKDQLDLAQKEIFRAQQIVDSVDRQRVLAEQEAQRNREKARKLLEERLVAQALEAGRREGYEEGMRRGRLAREAQERELEAQERELEIEREREREKRRREKERERARREEERLEREREREEAERRNRERERLEMERRERVRVELERLRRDRDEREKRERERMEEARRERERLEEEQRQRILQQQEFQRQQEESRRREYEEWDRKTKHHATQRARSNTLNAATANPNASTSHRSRARSGSVPSLSRPLNVLPPPPRPSTPPLPSPPAKSAPPEHRAARSRTPAPQARSHTPAPGSSTTPAGNPPPNYARRPSPPSSDETMVYVPLPQPPANYIPVAKKDGSVPIPPAFGFKSPPRNNDGTARPPRPSSRAGGFANPERERMRQMIIGAGNPETPTPNVRPFSRQADAKGKGKMRVVNEEMEERREPVDSPNGFPWHAPASPVVIPTIESPTPPSSNPSPPRASSVPPAMFMSTPLRKPTSPQPPGPGDPNASARSSGEESKWLLPPDFSYAGGHPTMTPMLVRTATSGTAPTIGIEPPSHSPTTEGDSSRAYDSGLLTPAGTVAHHERELEEHEHHSPPDTTTPQSHMYQPPMPTPVYGQPTGADAPQWSHTSPPQGQPPQYQGYNYSQSPQWTSGVQDKADQWVPPPVVPLSPMPAPIKSMDYQFAPSPVGIPRALSPGSDVTDPGQLNFGMVGMTSMATSKFLSPGRLDRPISLFSESDA